MKDHKFNSRECSKESHRVPMRSALHQVRREVNDSHKLRGICLFNQVKDLVSTLHDD